MGNLSGQVHIRRKTQKEKCSFHPDVSFCLDVHLVLAEMDQSKTANLSKSIVNVSILFVLEKAPLPIILFYALSLFKVIGLRIKD